MTPPSSGEPRLAVTDPSFSTTSDEVKAAREHNWYARTEDGLAVLRYAEARALLRHPGLRPHSGCCPARYGVTEGPYVRWFESWILHKDGEEHQRLRRLLGRAFAAGHVTLLAPRFTALAGELVDGFAGRGQCEFASEFAAPYSARVITALLGLPDGEWPVIARESAVLGLATGPALARDLPRVEAALQTLQDYADAVIADRRARPRDDFMTALVSAYDTSTDNDRPPAFDDPFAADELRDIIVLLIVGGYDATRHQLGLAVATFAEHPGQWDLLARDPGLGARAVEEVMRVSPAVRWVTRQARETFEFQGLTIEAGTTIHLFSEAAGTDPRAFGEPSFDITAERETHLGFGDGDHYCAGHLVARCDLGAALPLLARRLRGLRPLPGARWLPDSGATGPVALPIAFTPVP